MPLGYFLNTGNGMALMSMLIHCRDISNAMSFTSTCCCFIRDGKADED